MYLTDSSQYFTSFQIVDRVNEMEYLLPSILLRVVYYLSTTTNTGNTSQLTFNEDYILGSISSMKSTINKKTFGCIYENPLFRKKKIGQVLFSGFSCNL